MLNARLQVIASCSIAGFYLWGFYATLRMLYYKKVHTELQSAFLRDCYCILISLKLLSTNGIEKRPILLQFSVYNGIVIIALLSPAINIYTMN